MENAELMTAKLKAEIRHLNRMSDKLLVETRWYAIVVGGTAAAALISATLAIAKFFL